MQKIIFISLFMAFISCGKSFYNDSLSINHYKVAILLPNVKFGSNYDVNSNIDEAKKTLQQIMLKNLHDANPKLSFNLVAFEKDNNSLKQMLKDEGFNGFLVCNYDCNKIGNDWLSVGVFAAIGSFSHTEEYNLQMEIIEIDTDEILWRFSTDVKTSLSSYRDTFKGFMLHIRRSIKKIS